MDTFYLKQILDISNYTKNDTILKLFNIPQKPGENDANLVIKLTDVENEKNFVEIELKTVLDEGNILTYYNTYITGRFNDSDVIGASLRPAQNKNGDYIQYDGQWYSVSKNDAWGHETVFSWVGTPEKKQLGEETLSISYDYEKKVLYANNMVVVDFDDPIFYEKGFDGFSSGKVKLTIEGKKFSKSYIDFCILQIADIDLSKNVYYDVDAPKINIDYKSNLEIPNAVVGEKYNIFDADSMDEVDGICQTDVFVYKNYYMKEKIIVDSLNGYFIPKSEGNYYIVYKSKDLSGNVAEEIIKVTAISERPIPLTISLQKNDSMLEVGNEIQVFSNVDISGNIGNCDIIAYAVHQQTNERFDIVDGKFLPLYIGDYKVYVKAVDYVGSFEYDTFTIEVIGDDNGVVKFFDGYQLDKYFIKNATYTIKDYYAYKLTNSPVEKVLTNVFVNEDGNGFNQQIENNKYIVKANNTVQFRYEYNNYFIDSEILKVFDVNFGVGNNLIAENFFNCTNINKKANDNGVRFNVVNNIESSNVEFINIIQVEDFSLLFSIDNNNKFFNRLNIKLSDIYNIENQIIVSYYLRNNNAYFSYNNKEVKLAKSFANEKVEYLLQFNNGSLTLNDEKLSFYNSEFKGFTDSLAYLSIYFEGVNGDAGVEISQINGQSFNFDMTDNQAPQVIVEKNSKSVPFNSEMKVRKAVVKDVIDPSPVFIFQVKDPNGAFAKTKDGILLDGNLYSESYVIVADKYGYYNFTYKATDFNGNGQRKIDIKSYNLNSIDVIAPELSISKMEESYKVNSKIILPTITATDNSGCDVKISVVLIDSNGISSIIKEDSFEPKKAGSYTIIVTANDEIGNYTAKQISFEVR